MFYGPEYGHLGVYFLWAWGGCVFCYCWWGNSINVNLIKLAHLFRSSIPVYTCIHPFQIILTFYNSWTKQQKSSLKKNLIILNSYNIGNRFPCILLIKFLGFVYYLFLTMKRMYERKSWVSGWARNTEENVERKHQSRQ